VEKKGDQPVDSGIDGSKADSAVDLAPGPDSILPDQARVDIAHQDGSLADQAALDQVVIDVQIIDQSPPDKKVADQQVPDLMVPDLKVPDQQVLDQQVPDQAVPDQQVPDQAVPDQQVPDWYVPDKTPPDMTPPDAPLPTCSDKKQNGTETDIDCGGTCPACTQGKSCKADADCASADCAAGKCASCGDGLVNGADQCDGKALGGKTCSSLGYGPGTLKCTSGCTLDHGACLESGLELYYPFDLDTGTIARDKSGNSRDGSKTKVSFSAVPAVLGKSVYFNGTACISSGLGANQTFGKMTVAYWFRSSSSGSGWSTTTSAGGDFFSSEKGVSGGNEGHFRVGGCGSNHSSCASKFAVDVLASSPTSSSYTQIDDGKWHFATVVFDSASSTSGGKWRLFLDGGTTEIMHGTTAKGLAVKPKYNFGIGCRPVGTSSWDTHVWSHMDEVAVWSRVLTDKERLWLYNGGKGRRPASEGCSDVTKNGTETDIDCGGGCDKCADSKACKVASDCLSGVCTGGKCAAGCKHQAVAKSCAKDSSGAEWCSIPAGCFNSGSPTTEPCRKSDEPLKQVTVPRGFMIKSTEVTQGQFKAVMGYNPSGFSTCGQDCPVETVSWHEAASYCNALSIKAGLKLCYSCSGTAPSVTCSEASGFSGAGTYNCTGYRMATEAEWEYAYRAGTATAYYSGANDKSLCQKCYTSVKDANADKIGWYCANAGSKTHKVGQKMANAWGLYDMSGNVNEWTHDWWGVSGGQWRRAFRGGAWNNDAGFVRAASRNHDPPSGYANHLGFRVVRTIIP